MGTCNGITSSCALAGYAFETRYDIVLPAYFNQHPSFRCHLGKSVVFDTIGKMGWSADIRTHSIKTVIERLLSQDWDPKNNLAIPVAKQEDDCQVGGLSIYAPACFTCFIGRIVTNGNLDNTRILRARIRRLFYCHLMGHSEVPIERYIPRPQTHRIPTHVSPGRCEGGGDSQDCTPQVYAPVPL